MNDPHVVSLTYRLLPSDDVTYVDAPPLPIVSPQFRGKLSEGLLLLEPKDHYPTLELARVPAERFIRGWEIHETLSSGRVTLAFEYVTGELIDRNPLPPGSPIVLSVQSGSISVVGSTIALRVTRRRYPNPPADFVCTPDVDVLWSRLLEYREGREPLLSMAYFCLTWIERLGGSRPSAAKQFRIDKTVLDKLGNLTTNRGDAQTARKASRVGTLQNLTDRERTWIVACLEALVRRIGHPSPSASSPITMADLPSV